LVPLMSIERDAIPSLFQPTFRNQDSFTAITDRLCPAKWVKVRIDEKRQKILVLFVNNFTKKTEHLKIRLSGVVQGVGFRPFVYNLAGRYRLPGFVFNDDQGVQIEVEGEPDTLEHFFNAVIEESPPHSRIETASRNLLPLAYFREFRIEESHTSGAKFAQISQDLATCDDCLRELFDPDDRRFRYPFINCTNCGPRFTIISDIPYDRPFTTMAPFKMCRECESEYNNPMDRRFHAQPNACPTCGPQLELRSSKSAMHGAIKEDVISLACELLSQGKIVAVKGLGGFHLACDARNEEAVRALRSRKYREDKPFAVMMKDIADVRKFCHISRAEELLLRSVRRPIVLLTKRSPCSIAEAVAPNQKILGVILPYSPLHHLLLRESGLALVMTSANFSDEPIACRNNEAMTRLKHIADYFLIHDREIYCRCDDSVLQVVKGQERILRRSRGYVPNPIKLNFKLKKPVLACGPELKNTFCLARDDLAIVSHHIGDLENMETLRSYEDGIIHLQKIFHTKPKVIAHDLHPNYLSTAYAIESSSHCSNLNRIGVQHHHAHIVSCLAENGVDRKVIGIAMDGTGYGPDGAVWGGEIMIADFKSYERVGHLGYVPMPGGERAVREPWRMAVSYLYQAFGDGVADLNIPFIRHLDRMKLDVLLHIIKSGTNCPPTSSCGRLFDGVACIIGIRDKVNYEGQAAVELESMIPDPESKISDFYSFVIEELAGKHTIPTAPIIKQVVQDLQKGTDAWIISQKFHDVLVHVFVSIAKKLRLMKHIEEIALSGGCFQNVYLVTHLTEMLELNGFTVYTHSKVPTNDGGISLGQAVVANFAS
jgi:hydrogenase maturation protein HypF